MSLVSFLSTLPVVVASLYGDLFGTASISETPEGGMLIQSAPSRYLAWILAFPALLLISRWCWKRGIGGAIAPGFFFASFTIPLIIVPMLALESVRITPQHLTLRTGFWFDPTVREIPLTDVVSIVEREEASRSRRLPVPELHWHFRTKGGEWRSLDLPDLLDANRQAAADYLARQGHPVKASK